MRYFLLIALSACGPTRVVVQWATTSADTSERIEIPSSGNGNYTSTTNGVVDKNEQVILSTEQVHELDEMFLGQGVCQLKHDPDYAPKPGEGQTTLELSFPDQTCKVILWNTEWERGRAQPVAETMRSMRPMRPQRSTRQR